MTYQLVGDTDRGRAETDSIADLVLDGAAFRKSLIAPVDQADEVSSIGSTHTILSELKDRMDIVFEGPIRPMKLARQLLSLVSTRKSGRLVIWDMDHGADYFFRLQDGNITSISSSRLSETIDDYLREEGQPSLDWRGPMVSSNALVRRLVEHIGCDEDTANSAMHSWSIAASLDVFKVQNALIGWLEPRHSVDEMLRLPFGNFASSAFERSASPDELKSAVQQIKSFLVPAGVSNWAPWYPLMGRELPSAQRSSFAVSEVLDILCNTTGADEPEAPHYAAVLTLIAAGYFSQHTQAPISQAPVATDKLTKQRKLPKNYYRRLRVEVAATPGEIRAAHETAVERLDKDMAGGSVTEENHRDLLMQYEVAYIILSDRMMRRAFDQAQEAKVDFIADGLEARLLSEHYRKEGERALNRRGYAEAHAAFLRSGSYELTTEVQLMCSWSNFLNGDQNKEQASEAIAEIRSLGEADSLTDQQYLYMGKVARLSDDKAQAKTFLNQAVQLNDKNQEAWGELRLLNTEKANAGVNIAVSADTKDPKTVVLYALMCLIILYCGANLMPSDRTEWPEVGGQNAAKATAPDKNRFDRLAKSWKQSDEKSFDSDAAKEARTARPTEAIVFNKTIPGDKRVLGNVEYYHLEDDDWFWIRRALLVLFGLIGFAIFGREDRDYLGLNAEDAGLAIVAVPYGLFVGFLTAVPVTITPIGTLIPMGIGTAVAEGLFFFFFVGRCLLARIERKYLAAVLTMTIFGLHQLTYFATLATEPVSTLVSGVMQVTVFAGGVCAYLLYKSKSVVPPMLLLLGIQIILMLKFGDVL